MLNSPICLRYIILVLFCRRLLVFLLFFIAFVILSMLFHLYATMLLVIKDDASVLNFLLVRDTATVSRKASPPSISLCSLFLVYRSSLATTTQAPARSRARSGTIWKSTSKSRTIASLMRSLRLVCIGWSDWVRFSLVSVSTSSLPWVMSEFASLLH